MFGRRTCVRGGALVAVLAGCTTHHHQVAERTIAAPTAADSGIGTAPPLRACSGLVGKPAQAAIIGEQVTCSFGGSDALSHQVSVLVEKCPDTSPFYVFYSTATDAQDRRVYYGSESSPLFSTTHQAASLRAETRQVCGSQL